jgi:hypothetical protein
MPSCTISHIVCRCQYSCIEYHRVGAATERLTRHWDAPGGRGIPRRLRGAAHAAGRGAAAARPQRTRRAQELLQCNEGDTVTRAAPRMTSGKTGKTVPHTVQPPGSRLCQYLYKGRAQREAAAAHSRGCSVEDTMQYCWL